MGDLGTVVTRPVTATGVYTFTAYNQHFLSGWYFTETGGTNNITVTIRKNGDSTGTILQKLSISAGKSVGEDYDSPLDTNVNGVHVTVAGSGTCQGAVRGK